MIAIPVLPVRRFRAADYSRCLLEGAQVAQTSSNGSSCSKAESGMSDDHEGLQRDARNLSFRKGPHTGELRQPLPILPWPRLT